jgi:hypothetical protein
MWTSAKLSLNADALIKLSRILIGSLLISLIQFFSGDTQGEPEFAPMALNSYSSMPPGIVGANVLDPMRRLVGTVQRVELARNGQPFRLWVRQSAGREIPVRADHASYDEPHRLVVVDLS